MQYQWHPFSKEEMERVARYTLVGALTVLVYGLLNFALAIVTPLQPGVRAAIALFIGSAFNFIAHRKITYQGRRSITISLWRYAWLVTFNATFAGIAVAIAMSFGLSEVSANAICLAALTVFTYFALSKLVM